MWYSLIVIIPVLICGFFIEAPNWYWYRKLRGGKWWYYRDSFGEWMWEQCWYKPYADNEPQLEDHTKLIK